jgi:hypothetical protein
MQAITRVCPHCLSATTDTIVYADWKDGISRGACMGRSHPTVQVLDFVDSPGEAVLTTEGAVALPFDHEHPIARNDAR